MKKNDDKTSASAGDEFGFVRDCGRHAILGKPESLAVTPATSNSDVLVLGAAGAGKTCSLLKPSINQTVWHYGYDQSSLKPAEVLGITEIDDGPFWDASAITYLGACIATAIGPALR